MAEQNELSEENEEKEPSVSDEDEDKGEDEQFSYNEGLSRPAEKPSHGSSSSMKIPMTKPSRKRLWCKQLRNSSAEQMDNQLMSTVNKLTEELGNTSNAPLDLDDNDEDKIFLPQFGELTERRGLV